MMDSDEEIEDDEEEEEDELDPFMIKLTARDRMREKAKKIRKKTADKHPNPIIRLKRQARNQ